MGLDGEESVTFAVVVKDVLKYLFIDERERGRRTQEGPEGVSQQMNSFQNITVMRQILESYRRVTKVTFHK